LLNSQTWTAGTSPVMTAFGTSEEGWADCRKRATHDKTTKPEPDS
jgi:hypothetical protein